MLLMRQGEQAWLLTGSRGNHEFARLFWLDDKGTGPRYLVGQGGASRLGGSALMGCDIDERGARLSWSCGRKSLIPLDWFQYTFVST
jgi:hypothetical protein